MQKQINLNNELYYAMTAFLVLALYLQPLFFSVDGTLYVPPFDFLDISFPMAKILSQSGMLFAPNHAIIPNMMHGLPRLVFGSEFYYLPWLFKLCSPYSVYIINEALLHITAFTGMTLLLRKVFYQEKPFVRFSIVYSVALLYAMIPFFSGMGMSITALPLFVYLLLHIYNKSDNIFHWIALSLFPFFTSFVLVYVFAISLAILFYLSLLITKRKNRKRLLVALVLLSSLYLIAEYRLVFTMFFDDTFVSHRQEFIRQFVGFWDAYRGAHNEFLIGQSHSQSFQSPYVVLSILLGLISIAMPAKFHLSKLLTFTLVTFFVIGVTEELDPLIKGKWFLPSITLLTIVLWFTVPKKRIYTALLLFILLSAWWYGFWYYEGWLEIITVVPLLKLFDFSRYALLQPAIWYFLLALSFLYLLHYADKFGQIIVIIMVTLQFVYLWNIKPFYPNNEGLNFKSYYATELFEHIEKTIGLPKESYRVASVGIPPAVALFNGFYTLDGYSPNYPLSYKHQFRKIIADNFKTNENSRRFFDYWGNQCYIIAGDKGYEKYEKNLSLNNFQFNTDAFLALDGAYLISGYPIIDAKKFQLELIEQFNFPQIFWTVWLYKVN